MTLLQCSSSLSINQTVSVGCRWHGKSRTSPMISRSFSHINNLTSTSSVVYSRSLRWNCRVAESRLLKQRFEGFAAVDDSPDLGVSDERTETTTAEVMDSGGTDGLKKQEPGSGDFDQPWWAWAIFTFSYVGLALSFVPPELHGPFALNYSAVLFVLKSNSNVQIVSILIVVAHLIEALYARYLAGKADLANANLWFLSVLYFGLLSLTRIIAKAKAIKSN